MRLIYVLLLSGVLTLAAQEPVDYNGWLNQGVQHFKAARYAEAVASFERAVALDGSRPTARLYLGTAYMQQYVPGSDSPEMQAMARRAEQEFQQVLAIDAQNKTALSSLASLALNQKKWDDALGWYEKLIAIDPGNADAYYSLGFVAWSKWYPDYTKARKAAGMRQEDPPPLVDPAARAALNQQYGPLLQAGIDALNRALELRPDYADAMAYLNLLIRERADLRDSIAESRADVATADAWVQKALAAKKAQAERRNTAMVPAPPPPPPPASIKIAGSVMEGNLVTRVAPVGNGSHGTVRLTVFIDGQGNVRQIQVLEGGATLAQPVIDAVKQWKYRPTLLNGEPVGVMTEITVTM
jgi:tetratricopeptide (TPR) repeat protein